jgi:hypothetical protein
MAAVGYLPLAALLPLPQAGDVADIVYVIVLFSGAGGFTLGALMAGALPVLSVDSNEQCGKVHNRVFKTCEHWYLNLGGEEGVTPQQMWLLVKYFCEQHKIPLDRLHIHASPPCSDLSRLNRFPDVERGLALVEWCLDFFDEFRWAKLGVTYTLEQVVHHDVMRMLFRRQFSYRVVEAQRLGAHQIRDRVFAGDFDPFELDKLASSPRCEGQARPLRVCTDRLVAVGLPYGIGERYSGCEGVESCPARGGS